MMRSPIMLLAAILPLTLGCQPAMRDQPKYLPLASSDFFADGQAARHLPQGVVARGHMHTGSPLETGRNKDGKFVEEFPIELTRETLQRGQERYRIYCSVCHGLTGYGDGMIVQRDFRKPPSYHIQRLRDVPPGHIFDVITKGFGVMPAYAPQVPVADRWAIVAYVRVLQVSQHASLDDVPPEHRGELGSKPTTAP